MEHNITYYIVYTYCSNIPYSETPKNRRNIQKCCYTYCSNISYEMT